MIKPAENNGNLQRKKKKAKTKHIYQNHALKYDIQLSFINAQNLELIWHPSNYATDIWNWCIMITIMPQIQDCNLLILHSILQQYTGILKRTTQKQLWYISRRYCIQMISRELRCWLVSDKRHKKKPFKCTETRHNGIVYHLLQQMHLLLQKWRTLTEHHFLKSDKPQALIWPNPLM